MNQFTGGIIVGILFSIGLVLFIDTALSLNDSKPRIQWCSAQLGQDGVTTSIPCTYDGEEPPTVKQIK